MPVPHYCCFGLASRPSFRRAANTLSIMMALGFTAQVDILEHYIPGGYNRPASIV